MTLPLTMETRPWVPPLVPPTAIKSEPKQAKRTESQDSYYSHSASESAAPAAPVKTRGNGGGEREERPRKAARGWRKGHEGGRKAARGGTNSHARKPPAVAGKKQPRGNVKREETRRRGEETTPKSEGNREEAC